MPQESSGAQSCNRIFESISVTSSSWSSNRIGAMLKPDAAIPPKSASCQALQCRSKLQSHLSFLSVKFHVFREGIHHALSPELAKGQLAAPIDSVPCSRLWIDNGATDPAINHVDEIIHSKMSILQG